MVNVVMAGSEAHSCLFGRAAMQSRDQSSYNEEPEPKDFKLLHMNCGDISREFPYFRGEAGAERRKRVLAESENSEALALRSTQTEGCLFVHGRGKPKFQGWSWWISCRMTIFQA
jgi:hypothetical protein